MKNILIPTDFSPVADNALNYAIEIAEKFGSKLFLYHVYTFHRKVDYVWDFPEDEQPFVKNIEQKMDVTKRKFMKKIAQKGISLQTMVAEDNIYALFNRKVTEHGINLIVMGSKGASGLEKVVFGSVAATALDVAKVPVLVVPPKYALPPLEQIVLATDLDEVSPSVLSPLQKLAVNFGATVTILHVNTGTSEKVHHGIDVHLKDVKTTHREVLMATSINESINNFINKEKHDLLCMIRREKGFFESLFQGSITEAQVYSSKIPLLVLPEN